MEQSCATIKKKEFLEAYRRSSGSITAVCEAVGISRETFYDWQRKDPAFKQQMASARSALNEEVEDLLMEKIFIDKNISCIRYYLERRHPAYRSRREQFTWIANISSERAVRNLSELIAEESPAT
jgi:hypothetical protein